MPSANSEPRKTRKKKRVMVALRLKPDMADYLRRKAKRERMSQARVVEIALTLNGKAVKLGLGEA